MQITDLRIIQNQFLHSTKEENIGRRSIYVRLSDTGAVEEIHTFKKLSSLKYQEKDTYEIYMKQNEDQTHIKGMYDQYYNLYDLVCKNINDILDNKLKNNQHRVNINKKLLYTLMTSLRNIGVELDVRKDILMSDLTNPNMDEFSVSYSRLILTITKAYSPNYKSKKPRAARIPRTQGQCP